jgi:hypothetical protein
MQWLKAQIAKVGALREVCTMSKLQTLVNQWLLG